MNNKSGKSDLPYDQMLSAKKIFLSSSFPSTRNQKFYETADADEITQAIVALVRAVFAAKGKIVFGGHPTVSPLVLMVAEEYLDPNITARNALREKGELPVKVYQSEAFRNYVPQSTLSLFEWGLGEIVWTKGVETPVFKSEKGLDQNTVKESLGIMRNDMFKENLAAAIFIGGMEGIYDEADLFKKNFPTQPMYFVGAPGGASRFLSSETDSEFDSESMLTKKELMESRSYPSLMQRIVIDIGMKTNK